ncbi:PKD domain-containing protein [Runella sp.]|uniref:PKD domain-containing protein n=1 Tax=Runella sp. TaxID=1960881 RepID=UPI00262B15FF|nr:PKD domain-containing protein [Runella sp.]
MLKQLLFCFLASIVFAFSANAQIPVDFTFCTGTGDLCVSPSDSNYKLCLKFKPGYCATKEYRIKWGDGAEQVLTIAKDTTLEHTYKLRTFIESCSDSEKPFPFSIRNLSCSSDNKAYELVFNKTPQPRPATTLACEGSAVRFANNSCPISDTKFLWDFGDGQTSTAITPSITYSDPNKIYKVKLTATSKSCGSNTAEIDVKLKKLPEAKYVTTGFSFMNKDTAVVCLSNGATLTFDATISIDATRYEWSITPNNYLFLNNTDANSSKPVIQFTKAGVYQISLVAINECGRSKPNVCPHEVVESPKLNLPKQADVCQAPFKYKFTPQSGISYKLNSRTFDPAIGEDLMFQPTPYIVEASITDRCGGVVIERDTFLVNALSQVKITSLRPDTTLCQGTASVPLVASTPNGVWSGAALIEIQGTNRIFNPKTLGTYLIRYVVGSGTCSVLDSITVNVEGIKPDAKDLTVCQGTAFLKLQATPTGGRWTGCANCLRGDTLIISALTTNQIRLTYELTSPKGCPTTDDATINIGRPKADFAISNGCAGATIRPTNNSTGAANYVWLVNGTNASNVVSPQLSLPQGLSKVTLIAGSGACADTLTRDVTITAPPASAAFTLNQSQGCAPLNVTFTPTGTQAATTDYTWAFGDGTQHTGFQPPAKVFDNRERTEKMFTVTFTVKNTCGEQKTNQTITVRPLAKAEIGVDSTTVRCTPAQITFSNRSTGHDKPQSRWFFGDGTSRTSGADTLKHWFSAREYRVRLEVISACGRDSAEVAIRVFPTIVKPLFELSKSEVCPGEPIQFKDATTPKPDRWVWKFGDGGVDTRANPTHAFTQPNRDYVVTLIAYTTCGSDSTQKTVKVTQLPTGDFRLETPLACQGQPVQFVNLSNPQLGFIWDFGDGSPLDSVNYSPRHIYTTNVNNLSATLTVYRGSTACKSQPIRKSVPIIARSVADFRIEGDSLICAPGPVRLVNRSQNADTYKWYFSNGRTSDDQSPVLPFPKGQYDIKLVVSNRGVCKDSTFRTSAFEVDSCAVVIPQAFSPNKDGIGDRYTLFGSGIREIVKLRIRDRWGEVIFEMNNVPAGSQNDGEAWDGTFNGREMPADMYVVETEIRYIETNKRERLRRNFYLIR